VDLRWWPVFVGGLVCLAAGIALAAFLPMPRRRSRLRPLAHVNRLTRLPEYKRVVRLKMLSTLVVVALLLVMYSMALVTSSRPMSLIASKGLDAREPESIMVCTGADATDPATGALLNYFAQHVPTFANQRIGLTSQSLRLVPLTRDYGYAAGQFGRFADVSRLQYGANARLRMTPKQRLDLDNGVSDFSRPRDYVDYARSVRDVLALCIAGFPSFEDRSSQRRSLIYLGPSEIRQPDEGRPALFSEEQVKQMAAAAGVQVNVITPASARSAEGDYLRSLAADTGGRFDEYEPGSPLTATLDAIRANPPVAERGNAAIIDRRGDYPNLALMVGVAVSALVCLALMVARR
jgi:hypothetical protein